MVPVKPTAASFTGRPQRLRRQRRTSSSPLYPATTDAEAIQSAGDFVSDRFIAYSTWAWLEAQVKTGEAPVYRYRFDLGNPGDKFHPADIGAFHSDDIEYVFGTLDTRQDSTPRPEDRALSNQIQQYWTNFARNGNPNAPTSPSGPPTVPRTTGRSCTSTPTPKPNPTPNAPATSS